MFLPELANYKSVIIRFMTLTALRELVPMWTSQDIPLPLNVLVHRSGVSPMLEPQKVMLVKLFLVQGSYHWLNPVRECIS